MPDSATALPLAIDRVERSRAKHDQVRLRLTGHWLAGGEDTAADTLLVVRLHGRRHRFPASSEPGEAETDPAEGAAFIATFTVPDWAVPDQPGQAVLWVGEAVVPVPPPGTAPASLAPRRTARVPHPSLAPEGPMSGSEAPVEVSAARSEAPLPTLVPSADPEALSAPGGTDIPRRAGPLADLLLKETVAALHAELEQRAAEAARLRGALAQARTDLETRGDAQSGLESAHAELREELRRLMEAVAEQRGEFERALGTMTAERDGVREELDAARAEAERVRGELDTARGELDTARGEAERVRGELDAARGEAEAAQAEAAEQRAARAELEQALSDARADLGEQLAVARAEADRRVAAASAELEAQAAAARQETEAMLSAVRGEGEARAVAAEAQVRELSERLRERAGGERRHVEEISILRERLAAAHVAREAALGEAGGLRAELERLGSELGAVRERGGHAGEELDEARQLLSDARALTERLRGSSAG